MNACPSLTSALEALSAASGRNNCSRSAEGGGTATSLRLARRGSSHRSKLPACQAPQKAGVVRRDAVCARATLATDVEGVCVRAAPDMQLRAAT
eukprot:scaffold492_cov257-Pinguiococcus_pyrenoidosus.AAC.1